ncbi:hypothetical protein FQR65_LT08366 [Abscondita terminalis]|nr:hypothetical protein FQR65_LT08366 [Abscondita terminalis]
MNALVVLSTLLAIAYAQKPGYISGNMGQPELAYRFRDRTSTTSGALGNRLGDDTVPSTTPRIPIDARGDVDLVNRILTWPEENRPYWLVNYELIEKFRNQGNNGIRQQNQVTQQQRQQTTLPTRNREPEYDDFDM